MIKRKRWFVGIAITTTLTFLALGFAAMSVNSSFTVASWVPILFFVLAVFIFVVLIIYLTIWSVIIRVRLQWPVVLISKHSENKVVQKTSSVVHPASRRLEHDGVLWEDGGFNFWGNIDVIGPLCPKDYTPLATKYRDTIEVNIRGDTTISDSEYHSTLVCPECKTEYILGTTPKEITQSRLEVGSRFEGKRRREQQT